MTGFEYPSGPHRRRHGPEGYTDHESYREWLRDEFTFRCVYCLHREQWYGRGATFHIDHFSPIAKQLERKCEYTNLLYACATCNEAKKAIPGLPNPCEVSYRECLRILPDGRVEALCADGEKLSKALRLNDEVNVGNRRRWMRAIEALRTADPPLYQEFLGFPKNLPDLRKKHAPKNTKPQGAIDCYFALRERDKLPATY